MNKKQLINICLGNFFEHYDTALFGFLSPFLAPLIFPKEDPLTALLLTYAILPLSMVARPLGSLFFGYIGDLYGRARALFLTLTGIALVSCCIAFTPTYIQVGFLAPLLFFLGRALQNFFSAGETMGGAIYLLESASEKRFDLLSSFYSSAAIGGHLLASLGLFLLVHYQVIDQGWRFLYLFGGITALFGCLLRSSQKSCSHTYPFRKYLFQLKDHLWVHRKALMMITITSGFAYATYSVALVLMNGLIPLITSITKAQITKINTFMLLIDFCALPFFGWVASKISREKLMFSASLGILCLSLPLMLFLKGGSMGAVILVRMSFVLLGVAFFAPFHAWAQLLVPESSRYVVISFGYALGSQALGSPTATIALWSYQKTGMLSSVVWYWMLLAIGSSLCVGATYLAKKEVKL